MEQHIHREAEKWGRIIARAYSERANPPLSSERERDLADQLAKKTQTGSMGLRERFLGHLRQ